MRFALLLCLLSLSTGCLIRSAVKSAELPAGGKEVRDIAYRAGGADFDEKKHKLNIFVPAGPGPHPVVFFVHGGGWFFGDRVELFDTYSKMARRMASRGVLTVVTSYRLSPAHKHPAHIEDVASAIAWTFAHIREYGGDPSRIHLMGHSAGAHLVSLAACDPQWLGKYDLKPEQLAGVIAISGPYDVKHLGNSLFTNVGLVAPAFGHDKQEWRTVSPATYLPRSHPPPFLVAWAEGDFEILRHDAPIFANALRRTGSPVETFVAPYKGHFSVITDLGEEEDPLGDAVTNYVFRNKRESSAATAQTLSR